MRKNLMGAAIAALAFGAAVPASAAITWTDWTQTGANTVFGTAGGTGVTYTGSYIFAQTNGGTNYWNTGNPWDGTVAPPPSSDIIALNTAGTKTVTFGNTVNDVYFALTSWQGQNNVTFNKSFTQIGWVRGCGFWGCGLLTNVTPNSFTSVGESHGILKFAGPINSLTFQDSNDENWHGFQIGIGGAVPEPSTWALMIGGFGAIGGAMRMRRTRKLATA